MEYIVSARKYRPMTFDSVVGQQSLTNTLKSAVSTSKLAHAYLFCGPRGVGKTTCARIFAKVINCKQTTATGDACGTCESCVAFNEGRSLNIFELDAASNNGVDHIKTLMEQTRIPPQTGTYKVFIIDEVHMLSTQAFNAFLKTLEEPPAHVVFILATTEKHKILPTIISRCQVYDFERMAVQNIISHLKNVADKEGITYEERALAVIAEKADGGMRDALSIFDQANSFCQGNITYEKVLQDLNVLDADYYFKMIDDCLENKVSEIMITFDGILSRGFDAGHTINGLASHVRNLLMALNPNTIKLIEASDSQRQKYAEQAKRCQPKFLYQALKIMNQCDVNYRQSSNKRLLTELTLIQVAQITQPDDASAGVGRMPCMRLKALFNKLIDVADSAIAATSTSSKGGGQQTTGTIQTTSTSTIQTNGGAQATPSRPANANTSKPQRIKLGSLGVSFGNLMNSGRGMQAAIPDAGARTKEQESFNEGDVRREWLTICNELTLTQDKALAQRMRNVQLIITEFPHIDCVVENTILQSDIGRLQPYLQTKMGQLLHNGSVTLQIRLAKQQEFQRRLTPREVYNKLLETNKEFAAMHKALQLTFEG